VNKLCTAGLALLALAIAAQANSFDDFNHGLAAVSHGDDGLVLSLLSRALSAGDLAADLQPVALVDRGDAYRHEHKYPEAIADYDAALKLKPQYMEAFSGRIEALAEDGNKAAAASDCQKMVKAWPGNSGMNGYCGRLDWQIGNYSRAVAELEAALEVDPKSRYHFLWLCLAVLRGDTASKDRLYQFARGLDRDSWPAPLVDLYLGNGSLERAQRWASDGDDEIRRNRACEVGFYGGEWRLLQGDIAAARSLLKQAADLCPETYIELEPAKTELKRLSGGGTQ
jgi:lipoprotein NlpI